MTFLEMISLISERKEKVIVEKASTIQTDAHLYMRSLLGEWEEKDLPPVIEKFPPIIIPPKEKK